MQNMIPLFQCWAQSFLLSLHNGHHMDSQEERREPCLRTAVQSAFLQAHRSLFYRYRHWARILSTPYIMRDPMQVRGLLLRAIDQPKFSLFPSCALRQENALYIFILIGFMSLSCWMSCWNSRGCQTFSLTASNLLELKHFYWWRGQDLNLWPSGYEPDELPDCSTPLMSTITQRSS